LRATRYDACCVKTTAVVFCVALIVLPLIALEEQYNKKTLVGQTKSSVTFFAGDFLKDFEIFSRKTSDS